MCETPGMGGPRFDATCQAAKLRQHVTDEQTVFKLEESPSSTPSHDAQNDAAISEAASSDAACPEQASAPTKAEADGDRARPGSSIELSRRALAVQVTL